MGWWVVKDDLKQKDTESEGRIQRKRDRGRERERPISSEEV